MTPSRKIDYLCVGHLTEDVTPDGIHLGGTASFSSLTAKAFGISCGLITSFKDNQLPDIFDGIDSRIQQTDKMVQFENHYENGQRIQYTPQITAYLKLSNLPERFYHAKVTHFGPILNDFPIANLSLFQNSFLCITPQGWLRESVRGKVKRTSWENLRPFLPSAEAVILSQEDIDYNQQTVADMKNLCKLLIVTEGYHGAKLYLHGEQRHFQAPSKQEVDPTGAGDIFSTAFFILYQRGYSPNLAAEIATDIASQSVTRKGLDAIPKVEEIINIIYQHSIRGTV